MRYDQVFRADGYHSALLTTFSFDPTVFENVILIGMRSRGCRNIAILADQDMLNRTLSEVAPAPRAGTAYHLAKRKVSGAFHPKIALRLGKEGGSLMIGSANLTGAGLVGNLEAVSTLEVTADDMQAAPLLAAALTYFESHADPKDRAMRDVLRRARAKSPWLSSVTPAAEVEIDRERVAFVTETEDTGVGNAFASFIGDDVIDQLVAVSPYWDASLSGLDRLREELGGPAGALVVEMDDHDFDAATFQARSGLTLHSTEAHEGGGKKRRLHAKVIIACGRRADYILTGSSNVSMAGLYSRLGGPGNAEAGIMRTEPAGTAIDRLGLSVCLSEQMPLLHLRPRVSGGFAPEIVVPAAPDGGSLWIDHGMLFWRPPASAAPEGCQLRLIDSASNVLGEFEPAIAHGQWSCEFDTDGPAPRVGQVIFPDGAESAPVPIASLGRLGKSAEPVSSGRAARILAELEGRDDIDDEDYERALKIIMAGQQEISVKRDVKRDRKGNESQDDDPEDEDEGEPLSDEEYGEAAPTKEQEHALRSGPVGEFRRLFNSCLGLTSDFSDEDEDDALTKVLKDPNQDDKGPPPPPRKRVAPRIKGSMTTANERADRLAQRVNETCAILALPDVEPLSFLNAVRLHILINVMLRSSAPVGAKPDEARPISATEPSRSWIRLLGRLLRALDEPLARQVAEIGDGELEDECVDALATILFTAGIVLNAARCADFPRSMIAQLEAVNAGIAKSVVSLVRNRPAASNFVHRALPALSDTHARLTASPAP